MLHKVHIVCSLTAYDTVAFFLSSLFSSGSSVALYRDCCVKTSARQQKKTNKKKRCANLHLRHMHGWCH